ncbi:hypothetical protein LTR10_011334 [Elasticomyces elasticus]|nr:hypothetical protein LTR10_011334 [Elasticomyces elasticus]KAK4966253.1 hypothetical protein LTR42_011414 [Elasticomyces elasticus]
MLSFVRSLFGHWEAGNKAEALSPTPPERRPYNVQPVPIDASVEPADPEYYDAWAEQVIVVPSNDGTSVLIHHCWSQAEDPDTHEIIYHEHASMMRADETDWMKRIEGANRIYQHLFASQPSHPGVVGYLGPTNTGYCLERLNPGPIYDCELDVESSDLALALYQRWALQALSALEFIHKLGILQPRTIQKRRRVSQKKDLFNWAIWVCENMTGKSPFQHSMTKSQQDQGYYAEIRPLERALRRGEYNDWPSMPDQKLGPIVLKALRGQYETASEALAELKVLLKGLGRTLALSREDELQDYDWQKKSHQTWLKPTESRERSCV